MNGVRGLDTSVCIEQQPPGTYCGSTGTIARDGLTCSEPSLEVTILRTAARDIDVGACIDVAFISGCGDVSIPFPEISDPLRPLWDLLDYGLSSTNAIVRMGAEFMRNAARAAYDSLLKSLDTIFEFVKSGAIALAAALPWVSEAIADMYGFIGDRAGEVSTAYAYITFTAVSANAVRPNEASRELASATAAAGEFAALTQASSGAAEIMFGRLGTDKCHHIRHGATNVGVGGLSVVLGSFIKGALQADHARVLGVWEEAATNVALDHALNQFHMPDC
jgi:hypothetical protein